MSQTPAPEYKSQAFQVTTQCRRYDGRVVIVTGAAQGLGRVIARRVAEEGANVLVCDIQQARLERGQRARHVRTPSARRAP